jgi:S1-C subfamily serine protease
MDPQPDPAAVLVVHLVKGGPAFEAGLRLGDVLVRLGGKDVPPFPMPSPLPKTTAEKRAAVDGFADGFDPIGATLPAGEEVEVVFRRAAEERTVKVHPVTAAGLEPGLRATAEVLHPRPPPAADAPPEPGFVGLGLLPATMLPPATRATLPGAPSVGIVAIAVWPGLPAHRAGLRVGDRIVRYGGRTAPDTSALKPDDADSNRAWQQGIFPEFVGTIRAGDRVEVAALREGRELVVTLEAVDRVAVSRAQYLAGTRLRY